MNNSELQRAYSGAGHDYDHHASGPRVDKVRQIFASFPGKLRILDIGCANGAILNPFVKQHELHGVDICEEFVKLANGYGWKAVVHDVESKELPYPAETFDAVFSGETIEHQIDTDWLLHEINRVLRPGGKLVLTFPNIRTPIGIAMMLFFNIPPMFAARYRASHVRDFTLKTIDIALRNNGFKRIDAQGSSFWLPKVKDFWPGLARYFPGWASTTVVVAEKTGASVYPPPNLTEAIY